MCLSPTSLYVHKNRGLLSKADSERLIFEKLFTAEILTLTVFARNLLRGSHQRNISFYILCLTWDLNRGLMSYKPTHCLLDNGNLTLLDFFLISGKNCFH